MMMRRSLATAGLMLLASCGPLPESFERADVKFRADLVAADEHPSEPGHDDAAMYNDAFVGPALPMTLSEKDAAAIKSWKSELVKRCDARDALGQTTRVATRGAIDAGVLRRRMQRDTETFMATLATSEERVVFGAPVATAGESRTICKSGAAVVAASLQDGVCTLRVGDTVVYKSFLAQTVPVEARISIKPLPLTTTRKVSAPRMLAHGYVAASGAGIWQAVTQATRADTFTSERIGDVLGVPRALARRAFKPANSISMPAAVQLLHGDNLPWFSAAVPDIMGTIDAIATLFPLDTMRTRVRMVLRTQPWPSFVGGQPARPEWLTLEATVQLGPGGPAGTPGDVRLDTPRIVSSQWIDAYTGSRCLQDRAAMLIGKHEGDASVVPSWASIAEPCAVFDDAARPQGYTDGVYMDLLPQVLRYVRPGPGVNWRGWDTVLVRVALDLQRNRQNIAQTLDPQGQSPAIGRIDEALIPCEAMFTAHPRSAAARSALLHMAGMQALHDRAATYVQLDTVLGSLSEDYLQLSQEALDVATRYNDTHFLQDVYPSILQRQPSMHSLQAYIDTTGRRHAPERY